MENFPILSFIIFFPLLGALFVLFVRTESGEGEENCIRVGFVVSIITLLAAIVMWMGYDATSASFQYVEEKTWKLGSFYQGAYFIGVDGISLFFVLLATLLTPICVLASWHSVKKKVKEYTIAFLLLEFFMLGMFVSLDIMMFYIFFEAVLIPMFLIIGIWGGQKRFYAAFKFFLYTLAGSLLMFVGLLFLYLITDSSDLISLMSEGSNKLSFSIQLSLWLAFFIAFAIKVPMWPFHTWLPDAHVEAPTGGSVILAGVLLKMGGYGMLRFLIPVFPEATEFFQPYVMSLAVIAIIYTSLVAVVQKDMKKMIAYSSVAHMGYVVLGIFSLQQQALEGAIFQMISHGIVSAALFLCVGVVYDRLHTREIARYGGIGHNMPKYAFVFMIFMLASIGLPGTSGFIGEFLILKGAFQESFVMAAFAATGLVIGASYMLILYRGVIYGPLEKASLKMIEDLKYKEIIMFLPLIAIVFWMGIKSSVFLDPISVSVEFLLAEYFNKLSLPISQITFLQEIN